MVTSCASPHTCTIYCIAGNFHLEKLRQFHHLLSLASTIFLSYVNNDVEDMATFTAIGKVYSTEYFYNTGVAGLGEIFVL